MKISKGKWEISRVVNMSPLTIRNVTTQNTICDVWDFECKNPPIEQMEANAALIVDAGNTANECGLMPSELLNENKNLRESLKELLTVIAAKGSDGFELEVRLAESLLKDD